MKNKPESLFVGSICESNHCGKFKILEYKNSRNILVRFVDTGFESVFTANSVIMGKVKDRNRPTVYGVGFIGCGRFKSQSNGRLGVEYKAWLSMLQRCYSDKFQDKNPAYINCLVCDEWHNFQNFAEWYDKNHPKDGKKYEVDKDIKSEACKIYSPDHCLFVPKSINTFTTDCRKSRGSYMIGASLESSTGRFISQCCDPFLGKVRKLGRFDTEMEAHMAWRSKKYEHAINLAKQQDREEIKVALLNWAQALKEFRVHPIDN